VQPQHLVAGLGMGLERPDHTVVGRREDQHLALVRSVLELAVATTGRLGDLVQSGGGPQHERKIHVDTGLNEARGDDPTRAVVLKIVPDLRKHPPTMDAVHAGREMPRSRQMPDGPEQRPSMRPPVDNAQSLLACATIQCLKGGRELPDAMQASHQDTEGLVQGNPGRTSHGAEDRRPPEREGVCARRDIQ
jgi:hypothetical protein